jgi:ribosomal protein S24E
MNINIISQEKKPALSREEVVAEIDFVGTATPSRAKLIEEFSKKLGKDAKLVVVKKIQTHFGAASSKVHVYVYDKEDDLKKIEPQPKKEEKKAEGAPAAPAPEAPKPEPAKEEKPAEAPKAEEKKE